MIAFHASNARAGAAGVREGARGAALLLRSSVSGLIAHRELNQSTTEGCRDFGRSAWGDPSEAISLVIKPLYKERCRAWDSRSSIPAPTFQCQMVLFCA
jgi:hypothetical protein